MVRTKAKPRKNTDQSGATKRRPRRGKKVLKKIQQYQASTALSIPPLDFVRFLRKISTDKYPDIKCKVEAAMALQESAEAFLKCAKDLPLTYRFRESMKKQLKSMPQIGIYTVMVCEKKTK